VPCSLSSYEKPLELYALFVRQEAEVDLWTASYIALWILVLVEGLVLVLVLRSVATIFLSDRDAISRDGIAVGRRAPAFEGIDSTGNKTALADLLGQWVVLIFAAPACQICMKLVPQLTNLRDALKGEAKILVALRADAEVVADYEYATGGVLPVLAIGNRRVAERYNVRVSPFVHVLDARGVVRAKGLVNDTDQLEHLLMEAGIQHEIVARHSPRHPAAAGAHSHA
jgi:peroxiredoxin